MEDETEEGLSHFLYYLVVLSMHLPKETPREYAL